MGRLNTAKRRGDGGSEGFFRRSRHRNQASAPAAGSGRLHSPGKIEELRHQLGVPVAIVAAVAIWVMPPAAGLSLQGQRALALFAGIFFLYLTEAIPLAVSSLLVVPAAVLMGVAKVSSALEGFGSSSVYLLVGAFILATAMVKTKLAERITYLILSRTGCAPSKDHFRRYPLQHCSCVSGSVHRGPGRDSAAGVPKHNRPVQRPGAFEVRGQSSADPDPHQRHHWRRHPDRNRTEPGDHRVSDQGDRTHRDLWRVAVVWAFRRPCS